MLLPQSPKISLPSTEQLEACDQPLFRGWAMGNGVLHQIGWKVLVPYPRIDQASNAPPSGTERENLLVPGNPPGNRVARHSEKFLKLLGGFA